MERLALALHRRGNRCALWIPGPPSSRLRFSRLRFSRTLDSTVGRTRARPGFRTIGMLHLGFSLRRAYRVTLRKGMAIHAMTQASAPMIRASGQ